VTYNEFGTSTAGNGGSGIVIFSYTS
jgi:hypothetical protein